MQDFQHDPPPRDPGLRTIGWGLGVSRYRCTAKGAKYLRLPDAQMLLEIFDWSEHPASAFFLCQLRFQILVLRILTCSCGGLAGEILTSMNLLQENCPNHPTTQTCASAVLFMHDAQKPQHVRRQLETVVTKQKLAKKRGQWQRVGDSTVHADGSRHQDVAWAWQDA